MKMSFEKIFCWVVCLFFMAMPAMSARSSFVVDEFRYYIEDTTKLTVSISLVDKKNLEDVTIPDRVEYDGKEYTIVAIDENAFYNSETLKSVTIPNTVTAIKENAFYHCKGLTSITIPNSVTKIGKRAFYYCEGVSLVIIPPSVTSVGFESFSGISVIINETNLKNDRWGGYRCINGKYIDGDFVYVDEKKDSLAGYIGSGPDVTIPNTVTSIMESAFSKYKNLTSVAIPSSVTSIGEEAFYVCSGLKPVVIPKTVTSIGYRAFSDVDTIYYGGPASGSTWGAKRHIKGYYKEGNFVYADEKMDTLVAYLGTDTDVTIPSSVVSIGYQAFYNRTDLISVTIPSSVTSIGDYAFSECRSLETITIPSSLTAIGDYAFSECRSLKTITIPSALTAIGNYAFSECTSLSSVNIPNGVTSIKKSTFRYCASLKSITIPSSVTSIEAYAFLGCAKLPSVIVPSSVETIENDAFGEIVTIFYEGPATGSPWGAKHHVKGIIDGDFVYNDEQKDTLVGYLGASPAVVIPNHVKAIEQKTFMDNSLITSVTIPDSVTSIGDKAFYGVDTINYKGTATGAPWGAKIHVKGGFFDGDFVYADAQKDTLISYLGYKSIVYIPNQVKAIYKSTFQEKTNIITVYVPDSVSSIESNAFNNVINVVYNGTPIGNTWGARKRITGGYIVDGFAYTNDQKDTVFAYLGNEIDVAVPENVKVVKERTFSYTNITSVTIPTTVTSIGEYAFYGCTRLKSVSIPKSVTSIGRYTFYGCASLTSVTIPNSITSIGEYMFVGCTGLTSVTIPTSVTSIGEYAFYGCTGLKSISIPNSVTSIRGYAFDGCTGLTSVTIPTSVTSIGEYAFYGCTRLKSVSIPNSVTSIGRYMFYGCTSLTSVTIPTSVTSIGDYAFCRCTGLTSITIPSSVKTIEAGAFEKCNFNSVDVPNSVSYIGYYAFYGTDIIYYGGHASGGLWGAKRRGKVTDDDFIYGDKAKEYLLGYTGTDSVIVIPEQVKVIGDSAFYNNTKLISVVFNDSVKYIDRCAFSGCVGLTSVDIHNSVVAIERNSFYGCTGLTSLNIPNSVTTIRTNAFYGCTGLTSLSIPNSVTTIEANAFYGCTGITSVVLPDSITSVGQNAFHGIDTVYCFSETDTVRIIRDTLTIRDIHDLISCKILDTKGVYTNTVLETDIDLSSVCGVINGEQVSWTPIQIGPGVFDGGNHTISNLYINQPNDMDGVALFRNGKSLYDLQIKNLKVTNAYVKGGSQAAGIAIHGIFVNCHFEGVVIGQDAGGVNEYGKPSMAYNCSNYGLIVSSSYSIGVTASDMYNCYNRGRIVSDKAAVGLGMYDGSHFNLYNAGEVYTPDLSSIYYIETSGFKGRYGNLFVLQQMDSIAFLSGAVKDSLNMYVSQNPKEYCYDRDSVPLLSWVQGEDGFPRFEGVDLQPTQGYVVHFKGAINDYDVSLDGTIALPVCSVKGRSYVFSDNFDGKNIVSDTVVTVEVLGDSIWGLDMSDIANIDTSGYITLSFYSNVERDRVHGIKGDYYDSKWEGYFYLNCELFSKAGVTCDYVQENDSVYKITLHDVYFNSKYDSLLIWMEVKDFSQNSNILKWEKKDTTQSLPVSGQIAGHDYIDLGLPSGTLWATYNVGATKPTEFGDYFAWGETEPKEVYDWNTYKYAKASFTDNFLEKWQLDTLTKYNTGKEYPGTIDDFTTLLPEDDAATANWGGEWRMPTNEELKELTENCEFNWTEINGVSGTKFTAKNGNFVFFPAAGYRYNSRISNTVGINGVYWSSSLFEEEDDDAYNLMLSTRSGYSFAPIERHNGLSVRPVVNKNVTGYSTISSQALQVYVANGTIYVVDAQPNAKIQVFEMNGKIVASGTTDANGSEEIKQSVSKGVYVVTDGNQSTKVVIK